jgi:hypothetical protein
VAGVWPKRIYFSLDKLLFSGDYPGHVKGRGAAGSFGRVTFLFDLIEQKTPVSGLARRSAHRDRVNRPRPFSFK